MTVSRLCDAPYQRPNGTILHCQYLPGHPVERHSWWAAATNDKVLTDGYTITLQIQSGHLDAWLEAILAAAHNRKRTLRGVIT